MSRLRIREISILVTAIILLIALISVSVTLGLKIKALKHPSYYEQKVAGYSVENSHLAKGQIVFIGDSITDFYPLDEYFGDLSLRTYNRGISGDTTQGVLNRIDVSLYDLKPSKIVLMIGTNDVNIGYKQSGILKRYTAILDGIKTNLPQAEVYCMSILSQHPKFRPNQDAKTAEKIATIMELNNKIQPIVEAHGYTYLDIFSLTSDDNNVIYNNFTDDGLHPNANAYAVWTSLIKPYLG